MPTTKEVAQWMVEEMDRCKGTLDQQQAWFQIRQTFGEEFAGLNKNGGWAISPSVLKEFRKLTEGQVVWEQGNLQWRRRVPFDPPGRKAE